MSDEREDLATDRDGFLRIPPELYARWLRRCHREATDPDQAGAIQLERALRRQGSIVGEDTEDEEPVDEDTDNDTPPEEPDDAGS